MYAIARRLSVFFMTVLLASWLTPAMAQDTTAWPSRPIRLIVASAAGGGADTVARILAQDLSNSLKQPVVVENRAGGSGVIAANALLSAPKDGYTFLLGFTTMSQYPAIATTPIPYHPDADFVPISLIAKSSNVLVVNHSKAPVDGVPELVAAIKAQPQAFSYGSYGNGSTGHFLGALFSAETHTNAQHIAYKGAAPLMSDLLGGTISFAFPDIGSALPHLKSDRLRVLAVTSEKRLASMPDVPTMAELGYKGFNLGAWFGVFAAKGTPAPIVEALSARVAAAVRDPEINARLVGMNLEPVGSNGKDFARFFREDLKRWSTLASRMQIRAE